MQDVYKNIKYYKPSRKFNISIVLDNMIADTLLTKNLNQQYLNYLSEVEN